MVYYSAYIQLTKHKVLGLIVNNKEKNTTTIVSSFQFDIYDFINENGIIQYPLALTDEIMKRINTSSYSVKDISLIISPRDCQVSCTQENAILNRKELTEIANDKIESAFNKPSQVYSIGWVHTGNILDDGAPISVFLQYCYSLREINKIKKALSKNKVHVKKVILPEFAAISLFEQYFTEYNDPNMLIIETGFTSQSNTSTNIFSFKRNVLESTNTLKYGFNTVISEIQSDFKKTNKNLNLKDIYDLLLSCGSYKEYMSEETAILLDIHDITTDEWFAITERAFHGYFTILSNDITRRPDVVDSIVLVGPIAQINGIDKVLYSKYSISCILWSNEYELQIGQERIITMSEDKLNSEFAIVYGSVCYDFWVKKLKNNSLSQKNIEINLDRYRSYLYSLLVGVFLLFSLTVGPDAYKNYKYNKGFQTKQEEITLATQIESNIAKYKANIESQSSFLDRSKVSDFNMQGFMYSATLLKPDDITIISIDTPNYIEEQKVDLEPYYYIKKAVEEMRSKEPTDDAIITTANKPQPIDISGKDWTFGLPWTDVLLTPENIKGYLEENNIFNIKEYLITKIIIRGYGSSTSNPANYAEDLQGLNGVYDVWTFALGNRKIPDANGTITETEVFELIVWIGEEK